MFTSKPNLPNLRYAPEQRVEVYASAVRGLLDLEQDEEKQAKYHDFIDIYTQLDDNERQRYEQEYREEAQAMSKFADRFIKQGIEQGMQQGEARMLIRQLTRRFGEIPPGVRSRIETADADLLLEWSERVLTADSIDEVLH